MKFLKTSKGKIIALLILAVIIAAIIFAVIIAAGKKDVYRTISVSEISGDVKVENDGKVYDAYPDMNLSDGYALFAGADSYTRMVLDSDKYVKLEELSRALFEKLGKTTDGYTSICLENGVITNEITKPLAQGEEYIVNTPNAVLAVRGTFFRVSAVVDENGDYYTDVFTYGGSVECKRVLPDGTVVNETVMVDAGFKTRIKMDSYGTIYLVEKVDDNGNVMKTLSVSGNIHIIPQGTTEYSLSTFVNFDPSGISEVSGADYDSTTGTFSNFTGDTITYKYLSDNGSTNYLNSFTISVTV